MKYFLYAYEREIVESYSMGREGKEGEGGGEKKKTLKRPKEEKKSQKKTGCTLVKYFL